MPRPREFDPDDTVKKAMEVFWRKGYVATSVQDLVTATGVNRASLYATFGDKHGLFLKALAYYAEHVVPSRTEIIEGAEASLPQIREYFEAVASDLVGQAKHRGCLMVNSAVELAAHDRKVGRRVAAHLARLEKGFASALRRAIERREVRGTKNVDALAGFLTSAAQGLMVVGKADPDRNRLASIVDATLGALE